MPILSVDYSLAPRASYPRALEEVKYFLREVLGSKGECINKKYKQKLFLFKMTIFGRKYLTERDTLETHL